MATVQDIFNAAMALTDELEADGSVRETAAALYAARTPAVVNLLLAELRLCLGSRGPADTVAAMTDDVPADEGYARAALPCGLAAHLLIDENPAAAAFLQQRYEALRERFLRTLPAVRSGTVDCYGGVEFGRFGRW